MNSHAPTHVGVWWRFNGSPSSNRSTGSPPPPPKPVGSTFKYESELFGCNAFALVLNEQGVAVTSCARHHVLGVASSDTRRSKSHLSHIVLDCAAHLIREIGWAVVLPKQSLRL